MILPRKLTPWPNLSQIVDALVISIPWVWREIAVKIETHKDVKCFKSITSCRNFNKQVGMFRKRLKKNPSCVYVCAHCKACWKSVMNNIYLCFRPATWRHFTNTRCVSRAKLHDLFEKKKKKPEKRLEWHTRGASGRNTRTQQTIQLYHPPPWAICAHTCVGGIAVCWYEISSEINMNYVMCFKALWMVPMNVKTECTLRAGFCWESNVGFH